MGHIFLFISQKKKILPKLYWVRTKADDAADDGVRGGDVPAVVTRHGQPDGAHTEAGGHAVRCEL